MQKQITIVLTDLSFKGAGTLRAGGGLALPPIFAMLDITITPPPLFACQYVKISLAHTHPF